MADFKLADEITPGMIDAGERAILREPGVAEVGVYFSARELAEKVYLAMESLRKSSRAG